jgi:tetratricopeptide (TPR) repeat protein
MKVELVRAQKILDQQTPNPDAVLKLLTPLLKRDAKHWLVYYFLGIAQLQKANFEKAIHYFDKSNAENSENAQTYFLIAKSYYGLQNFGQAELYAKAAIKLKQEQLEVWMFLGNMYWEQALLNKAIQCYTVA